MGDGTEPIPRLDSATLQRLQRDVMAARDRQALDRLTRSIWRTYEDPKDDAGRAQLRAAIEAKRDVLKRNNPR